MTAEEMFIKLGFTKKITPNTLIMYGCCLLYTSDAADESSSV